MIQATRGAAPAPEHAPAIDDRALFGHPRGLGLLFAVEMWERFSYYGMRAILMLYLVNALRWDTARAAGLYGTYIALVYLTPLLGGWLADRWLGTRHALVVGGLVIAAGHFALALPGMATFQAGLGLIIVGTGLFKPSASTMVGQLYREGDPRRDAGYTVFYLGINLGAFLGPIVCGGLAESERFGWHWGFAAAGVGMVLGLLVNVWGRGRYLAGVGLPHREPAPSGAGAASGDRRTLLDGLAGALAGGLLAAAASGLDPLGVAMGAVVGAALAVALLGTEGEERRRVVALFVVVFFVVFFWAAYEQSGSSMNLFADRHTDLRVGGFAIPASWFQSVNALAILVFATPVAGLWTALGRRGREPSTAMKMVLGLLLLGVGFLFMMEGGRRADRGALVSPLWLLGAYLFHTFGELCLSPVGLSYVSKVAPARLGGLLMGTWFLANAAAGKLAGALAAYTPTPGQAPPAAAEGLGGLVQRAAQTHLGFYAIFVVSSLAAAGLLLLFVPLLKRLTSSVRA